MHDSHYSLDYSTPRKVGVHCKQYIRLIACPTAMNLWLPKHGWHLWKLTNETPTSHIEDNLSHFPYCTPKCQNATLSIKIRGLQVNMLIKYSQTNRYIIYGVHWCDRCQSTTWIQTSISAWEMYDLPIELYHFLCEYNIISKQIIKNLFYNFFNSILKYSEYEQSCDDNSITHC